MKDRHEERLCVEMINHLRNFLIVKTVKDSRGLIICTDDEYNSIVYSAENFTLENVIYALDHFQDTLTKIKSGANARSAPTGTPYAKRLTVIPIGLSKRLIYIAVASPSTVGLVAIMTSSTSPLPSLETSSLIRIWSGPNLV